MTNTNLITVFSGQILNQSVQLANASDLHSFLEVKSNFRDWIKNRITDYGFIQDEDYIIVHERTNGRPRKEYHITLDMGKELAMVERNEKGRQIRKYFIECERRANSQNQPQPLALPEPEKKYTFEFTEDTCLRLVSMWFALYNNLELLNRVHKPLEMLGSRYGIEAYTHATEYQTILGTMKTVLEPMTKEFNPTPSQNAHYCKALQTLRSYQLKELAKIVKHPTPPTPRQDI